MPGGRRSRPTLSPVTRGCGIGRPVSTDHMSATSATERAIGPAVSSVGQSGNTPSIGIAPQRGFRPTTPHAAAGSRIEQPVSEPRASSHSPAASAAPLPLEEPPVVRPGRAGLRQVPKSSLWPSTLHANSGRCVFPTSTAPASSRRRTETASRSGTCSA
jgi:hypothetical protein